MSFIIMYNFFLVKNGHLFIFLADHLSEIIQWIAAFHLFANLFENVYILIYGGGQFYYIKIKWFYTMLLTDGTEPLRGVSVEYWAVSN